MHFPLQCPSWSPKQMVHWGLSLRIQGTQGTQGPIGRIGAIRAIGARLLRLLRLLRWSIDRCTSGTFVSLRWSSKCSCICSCDGSPGLFLLQLFTTCTGICRVLKKQTYVEKKVPETDRFHLIELKPPDSGTKWKWFSGNRAPGLRGDTSVKYKTAQM